MVVQLHKGNGMSNSVKSEERADVAFLKSIGRCESFKGSRAEAIERGLLIDEPIEALRKEMGVLYPCAMSMLLFCELDPTLKETNTFGQSLRERVWEMLRAFSAVVAGSIVIPGGQFTEIYFPIKLRRPTWDEVIIIKVVFSRGDDGNRVITFMQQRED